MASLSSWRTLSARLSPDHHAAAEVRDIRAGERERWIVKRINVPAEDCATLCRMSTLTTVVLMVATLLAAYLLWSLLLRAEYLYTRLEGPGGTAADIAGVAFLALAAAIVIGTLGAFLFEARLLIGTLSY